MEKITVETERKYNELCAKAFINVYTFSCRAKRIYFKNLDLKNKNHLFLLHVALGLSGVVEKSVALNKSKIAVWWLNKKLHIRDKNARIISVKNSEPDGIDANEILSFMLPYAHESCGTSFEFGDIYNHFYKIQKGKK